MPLILDLAREYEKAKDDPAFQEELAYFQRDYVGTYRARCTSPSA